MQGPTPAIFLTHRMHERADAPVPAHAAFGVLLSHDVTAMMDCRNIKLMFLNYAESGQHGFKDGGFDSRRTSSPSDALHERDRQLQLVLDTIAICVGKSSKLQNESCGTLSCTLASGSHSKYDYVQR